jgi:hypothetical protein
LTTPVPGEQSVKFPNSPRATLFREIREFQAPSRHPVDELWATFWYRLRAFRRPVGRSGQDQHSCGFGLYYLGVADNGNFGILGDAPWGLYWDSPQPVEFGSPYITRANGVSQGQHFPFTFPSGPGPFPNFEFGNLMPLYVPGYYNHNKTDTAQHFNLSIQRQLDKSTVLTVAYVGTQGTTLSMTSPYSMEMRRSACRLLVADRMAKPACTRKMAKPSTAP